MNWFEGITGFREKPYTETRDALSAVDGRLHAQGRDCGVAVGMLTLPSLAELRAEAAAVPGAGRLRLSIVEGDVRAMHRAPENRGALFQVASQFNMLEMVGPECDARTRRDRLRGRPHAGSGLRGGGRRRHDLPQLPRARGRAARPDGGAADRRERRPPGRTGTALGPASRRPGRCATATPCPPRRASPPSRATSRAPTRPRSTGCAACCGSGCTATSR